VPIWAKASSSRKAARSSRKPPANSKTVWEIGGPDRPPGQIHAEQPTGRLITFPNNEILTGTVVNLTPRTPESTDAARLAALGHPREAFSERLGALSRANYLVAAGGWRSTRFANLLAEILQPFEDRLTLSGLDVLLPPELCFDLGLVIHELASNSIRHGSLGKGGTTRAELSWRVDVLESGRNVLVLLWRDPVNREANPTAPRQGFGTRLLDGLIVRKWEGSITIDRQNGFAMTARIPFDPV
jgi:two-component sensor histidine kinase